MIKTGKYLHYKGKEYEVLGTAIHSETLEEMVIYKPLYKISEEEPERLWVRPAVMFEEEVRVGDKLLPRFRYIE